MYKVVNGQLYSAPETYRDGKKIITNFDKNKGQQKKYGFNEIKEVDVPEYDSETEYIEVIRYEYTEDGEYIIPVYEVKKLADRPIEPTPVEPSEDESESLNKDIENIKNKLDIVYECLIDLYENPSKNGKPKDKPESLINWNTYNEKIEDNPIIEEIPTEPEVIPEDNDKK